MGLSEAEFAVELSRLLSWEPSADVIRSWVRRGHRTRERLPETPETYVVLLITQRGQGESQRRRSANAELLAPQRNECRENIQRLGKGWRRGSYLGLDGRDQAPAHLLAELQVHVPVPL